MKPKKYNYSKYSLLSNSTNDYWFPDIVNDLPSIYERDGITLTVADLTEEEAKTILCMFIRDRENINKKLNTAVELIDNILLN